MGYVVCSYGDMWQRKAGLGSLAIRNVFKNSVKMAVCCWEVAGGQ